MNNDDNNNNNNDNEFSEKEIKQAAKKANVALRKDFVKCWLHASPGCTKEYASRLYDHMVLRFPELTRGGHRGLVGRLRPWESLEHECPYCGRSSSGIVEIDNSFGRRLYRGKLYFQSWCRPCRSKGEKKKADDPTFGERINPLVENVHVA